MSTWEPATEDRQPWATVVKAREETTCEPCANVPDGLLGSMLTAATDALYLMSGRQFPGPLSATVVPAGSCLQTPVLRTRTGYVRRYGWDTAPGCCRTRGRVELGATPVRSVTEVILDGVVLDVAEYHVDDDRTLVREEGGWPCCPDLASDPPDFEVTFTYGADPPDLGVQAAIDLACELALARCSPEACGLNRRVTQVARQGVTVALPGLVDALAEGRTGVVTVDLFLHATNPNGLRRRGRVLSPDRRKPHRTRTA